MDKFVIAIGLAVLGFALIGIFAVLNGTILWFVWPPVMVSVFHLPPLTLFQAICLSWVAGILFKNISYDKKS